ncbi:hypothetical protein GOBAR_DD25392 [Gossypium barbadense]|nr:hypothetical protein GOBAR_DD25392 [Gossypium barbadense]
MSRNETLRYVAQASTVPLVDTQSSDAPRSSHEAYPALPTPPSLRTICLLKVINGPSLQVNARVNALTTHFDDRYNQLDKRINEPEETVRTTKVAPPLNPTPPIPVVTMSCEDPVEAICKHGAKKFRGSKKDDHMVAEN